MELIRINNEKIDIAFSFFISTLRRHRLPKAHNNLKGEWK